MHPRIDVSKINPAAFKAVLALQTYVDQSGLDAKLRELIKIRASQINGCAYCLIMHTRDARKIGESDDRMHLLNAWREAPVFTREGARRAGLDRSPHTGFRNPRAGRSLRAGAASVLRERDRRPDRRRAAPSTPGTGSRSASARRRRSKASKPRLKRQPIRFRPLAYCLRAPHVDVGAGADHVDVLSVRACGSRAPARRRSANCRGKSCPR